jgi:hypothetical protein
MLKVTLEFPDTDALVAFFSRPQITAAPSADAAIVIDQPAIPVTAATGPQAGAATPSTPANKRGRKPKNTAAKADVVLPDATGAGNGEVQETVATNGPSAPPEHTPPAAGAGATATPSGAAAPVTIEQARGAMNEVMQAFGEQGLEKVAEILNGIGFQRISEVTAGKYPLVVERCKAALAVKQ